MRRRHSTMTEEIDPYSMSLDNRDMLRRLIELNFAVGSAGRVRLKDKDWQFIETLAIKVTQHAATAYWLAENKTRLMPNQAGFIDWPSIQVLCRACIEAYLTLSYLYMDPPNRDAAEFRYCSWMIAGFAVRQSFPVVSEQGRRQQQADAKFLKQIRLRLEKTGTFQSLKPKHQNRVVAGHNWPPDTTLTELAEKVFGPEIGVSAYRYLSGHAHSSALSAVQMRDVEGESEQRKMADGALWLIAQTVAKTTKAYAKKFVYARKALNKHPDEPLNNLWANLSELPPSSFGIQDDAGSAY